MYIFISHSSKDSEVAAGLCKELENNGIECFLAPRDIRSGYEYAEEIINGIDRTDAMILVLSERSNTSPHVLREVERAVSKNIPIIVYKIEDVVLAKSMEYFLMTHQWVDGKSNNYQEMIVAVRNIQPKKEKTDELAISVKEEKKQEKSGKIVKGVVIVALALCACIVVMLSASNFGGNKSKGQRGRSDSQVSQENAGQSGIQNVTKNIELGDVVILGQYNGAPIKWYVLKMSEDKKEAILVASEIITMKAYDAADSDTYNMHGGISYYFMDNATIADDKLQAFVRGNSDWENSDIRAWLNSEKNLVDYGTSAPSKEKMSELKNAYDNEPGFLTNFTQKELEAIKTTVIETKGNILASEKVVVTEDKVYLLASEDLELFKKADLNMLTKPTEECLEQDMTQWYDNGVIDGKTEMYFWWLRDPVEEFSSECYLVGTELREQKLYKQSVGIEGFGIRPAITVDLTSDAIVIED